MFRLRTPGHSLCVILIHRKDIMKSKVYLKYSYMYIYTVRVIIIAIQVDIKKLTFGFEVVVYNAKDTCRSITENSFLRRNLFTCVTHTGNNINLWFLRLKL